MSIRNVSPVIGMFAVAGLAAPAFQPVFAQDASVRPMIAKAKALYDAGGGGRYKAEMVTDATLPVHVIYRPRDLKRAGKIPIVAWGNGGCFNRGDIYKYFLTEMASNGYLVIASGALGTNDIDQLYASMGDPVDPNAPPQGSVAARAVAAPLGPNDAAKARLLPLLLTNEPIGTTPEQMKQSIDWAFAENGRRGSPYYGRLDTSKVAVMGVSCGGGQAVKNSTDPRVKTTIVWNSAGNPKGSAPAIYHAPVAYISGDESDILFDAANRDFGVVDNVPIFRAYKKGIGHDGTYVQPAGGEYGAVGIAWLNWILKNDATAGRMFKGKDCDLCTRPDWTVRKKKID